MADKNDDFYNSVYGKYHAPTGSWGNRPKKNSRAKRIQEELLVILKEIANKSGFNTNAPHGYYEKAKELMEELKKRLQNEKN